MSECTFCKLHLTRRCITKPIFDSRAIHKAHDLLFLLEGPSGSGELFGATLSKVEMRFIDSMVNDACEFYNLPKPTFTIASAVLCRATNGKREMNRAPSNDEVLACMANVTTIIDKVNPKTIIFMSRVVEKFYKKEYKNSAFILPPDFLIKQGGPSSSWYPQSFRTLADVISKLQNERALS